MYGRQRRRSYTCTFEIARQGKPCNVFDVYHNQWEKRITRFKSFISPLTILNVKVYFTIAMPDPNLEIKGGGRSPRPLDKGGGDGHQKKIFSALRESVWSKNKGGGGLPGPSAGSVTELSRKVTKFSTLWMKFSFSVFRQRLGPYFSHGLP